MAVIIKLSHVVRCEVCGHIVNIRFIRSWNDRHVCTYCITTILSQEVPHDSRN